MGNRVWRRIRMYEQDRVTTFQFFEDRLQYSIAEVNAVGVREQYKSIQPEDLICVRQLLQGGIDIRQRETGKAGKAVWLGANELSCKFIAPARQRRGLGTVRGMHAGCTHRHDGDVYSGVIHERDACFLGPAKRRKSSDGRMRVLRLLPEKIWQYVVMGVDGQRSIWIAGHAIPCCQPRISSTARPAIMWVDAFVPGPVMICGITEASATRKPEMPCTRSSGSTTASVSTPILHVPTACPKLAEASRASSRISSALAFGPGMSSLTRKLSKAC